MSSRQDNIRWLEESIRRVGLQAADGHVPFPFAVKVAMKLGVQAETAEDYVKFIAASGPFGTDRYNFIVNPASANGSSIVKQERGVFDRMEDTLTELVRINTRILSLLEEKR